MHSFRLFLLGALLTAAFPALAQDTNPDATPAPTPGKSKSKSAKVTDAPTNAARPRGLLNKILHPIRADEKPGDDIKPIWHQLALVLQLDPQPLKLGEARQLKVSLLLINKGKKAQQLEFPTTQRIEVIVKNGDGKMIEQWSEDHAFTNEPGMITVNPDERLEYSATVSTREMKPFQSYTIEAFFPQYDALHVQREIVPGK